MQQPDFWTTNAEALHLTLEGNRLIAREISNLVRGLWHRTVRSLDGMIHNRHQHLPPV